MPTSVLSGGTSSSHNGVVKSVEVLLCLFGLLSHTKAHVQDAVAAVQPLEDGLPHRQKQQALACTRF